MLTLKQALDDAKANQYALGHFNVSSIEVIWAIVDAAKTVDVPVIIGVSEGERDFIGVKAIATLIHSIKDSTNHPIFLNADHTFSFDRVKEVIDEEYDSVIVDAAKLSLKDNTRLTQQCVDYARSHSQTILVESEVGYIGTSSALMDSLPSGATVEANAMPSAETVAKFVTDTGIDCVAPAVGNVHGMLKNASNPKLNIDLIHQIVTATSAHLVLHGGSGITDEDFRAAISAGISAIHINTEIRAAWKHALQSKLSEDENEVAPYKLLKPSYEAVLQVVASRLRLFSNKP